MATEDEQDDGPQDANDEAPDALEGETDAQDIDPSVAVAPAAAPTAAAPSPPTATMPDNLAELSAQLREAAAEIAEIAAQAGRLGIPIDAAKALREGTAPEALRRLVLERASAAADARDIVAAPPSTVLPRTKESPIVAAAKRAAAVGGRG